MAQNPQQSVMLSRKLAEDVRDTITRQHKNEPTTRFPVYDNVEDVGMAMITGSGINGGYSAVEVTLDSNSVWVELNGGRKWGYGDSAAIGNGFLDDLYEINDKNVSNGTIVKVFFWAKNKNVYEWFFNAGGESVATLAKIIGHNSDGSYNVDFYEDGKHEAITGSGIVEVLNISLSETLPNGTWIIANAVVTNITGGSSNP